MERRKSDRKDVRLTCYLDLPAMGAGRLTGTSENISRSGMLLTLTENEVVPDSIEVGRTATVEVPLPVEHDLGPRSMQCKCKVVRVANRDEQVHIAVRFMNLRFRDTNPGFSQLMSAEVSRYVM